MCECKCKKFMTFREAKGRLKSLANGRYHSISYTLTENHMGGMGQECYIYVDNKGSADGATFEQAFDALCPPALSATEVPAQAPTAEDMEAV